MKLLVIIVQKPNTNELERGLISAKFQFTRLKSYGGFLQKKNSTYLLNTEDQKVDAVLGVVKKTCYGQEEIVTTSPDATVEFAGALTHPKKMTVRVGGAVILILPCEKMVKV